MNKNKNKQKITSCTIRIVTYLNFMAGVINMRVQHLNDDLSMFFLFSFLFDSNRFVNTTIVYDLNFNSREGTNFSFHLNLAVLESSFQMINQYTLVIMVCLSVDISVRPPVYDPALYFKSIIEINRKNNAINIRQLFQSFPLRRARFQKKPLDHTHKTHCNSAITIFRMFM